MNLDDMLVEAHIKLNFASSLAQSILGQMRAMSRIW